MKRVLSGVQPSGQLHIGNYFGALRHFVPLQDKYQALYCVVDLHAITVPQDPASLRNATLETTAAFLAAGLSPERAILFHQSGVAAHTELAWLLNCVVRVGWLERMTQFKDKSGKQREAASAGLYVYPALMAADILLYRAHKVPVGEDQKQHLELVRDIAEKFNHDWCAGEEYFPLPEPLIDAAGARIMSLRDGSKKMSKSDAGDASCIYLRDTSDAIARKIKRAKSDSELLPNPDSLADMTKPAPEAIAARPEAWNLLGIWRAASNESWSETLNRFANRGFADLKRELIELLVSTIVPIGAEMQKYLNDPHQVQQILNGGALRAAELAEPVVKGAAERMGLLR
ncbi:MAG: tryptophan--tRNA ligase [Alphaproteobacteria bacterium]